MNIEMLTALILFAFVGSVTPGPNNLMLMASGANFGVRRTLPHVAGIVLGFIVMVVLVGTGLMRAFDAYPASYTILRYFSIAYLSWLAWKIATARPGAARTAGQPLSALQAALFQWVNPKAWAMALTAITVYAPSQNIAAVAWLALVLGLVNLPSIFVWVVLGSSLKRFFDHGLRPRVFNYTMALLLLATLYPVVTGDFG